MDGEWDLSYVDLNEAAEILEQPIWRVNWWCRTGAFLGTKREDGKIWVPRAEVERFGRIIRRDLGATKESWRKNGFKPDNMLSYKGCLRVLLFVERHKDILVKLREKLKSAWSGVLDRFEDAQDRRKVYLDHLRAEYDVVNGSKVLSRLRVGDALRLMDMRLMDVQERLSELERTEMDG